MKKQLHTLLFMMLMPLAVMAQDNDFGMNYSAGITKKIDKKWSVGGELEMRTCNNTQTFSRFSGAVEGQYKFTKWLKASAEYKFLYDRRNEKLNEMSTYRPSYFTPRHRVSVSLTADATKGRFKFSLRERWQYTYRPAPRGRQRRAMVVQYRWPGGTTRWLLGNGGCTTAPCHHKSC